MRVPKAGPAVGFRLVPFPADPTPTRTAFVDRVEILLARHDVAVERLPWNEGTALAEIVFPAGRATLHLALWGGPEDRAAAWIAPHGPLGIEAGRQAVAFLWQASSELPACIELQAWSDLEALQAGRPSGRPPTPG